MKQKEYAVILVNSTNHAIRAESLLEREGISCKLIPVPRQLSSDCGVCLRILRSDQNKARKILKTADLKIAGVHDL
jgi:hypothetical protein